jgi:hypothetical protein
MTTPERFWCAECESTHCANCKENHGLVEDDAKRRERDGATVRELERRMKVCPQCYPAPRKGRPASAKARLSGDMDKTIAPQARRQMGVGSTGVDKESAVRGELASRLPKKGEWPFRRAAVKQRSGQTWKEVVAPLLEDWKAVQENGSKPLPAKPKRDLAAPPKKMRAYLEAVQRVATAQRVYEALVNAEASEERQIRARVRFQAAYAALERFPEWPICTEEDCYDAVESPTGAIQKCRRHAATERKRRSRGTKNRDMTPTQ